MKKTLLLTILTLALCACDELMPGNKGSSTTTYTSKGDGQRDWLRNSGNKGLALVIGNSKYQHGTRLSEPTNDAETIADALSEQGYDIELGYNLNEDQLYAAVDDFAKKIDQYESCIFYYAGHGFQVDGINYLIPVDANPSTKAQVRRCCMPVSDILDIIDKPAKPKLILMDACRNNPFERNWRATDRDMVLPQGMTGIPALTNSLVVFSTPEGTTVSDHNQFAEQLADNIREGGCVNNILGKVAQELLKINKQQLIRPTGLLFEDICFGNNITKTTITHSTTTPPNPDRDGDGVTNDEDECPDEVGSTLNNGCPNNVPTGMVFIKGGSFDMGCTDEQGSVCIDDEKPVHLVTLSDFLMGEHEVTVAEFQAFVDATSYKTTAEKEGFSLFWIDNDWQKKSGAMWRDNALGHRHTDEDYNHPVIHVSWNDAVAYCEWKTNTTGRTYRLPTEAEWEYAARGGGQKNKYSGTSSTSSLSRYGNFCDTNCEFSWKEKSQNDGYRKTSPVGHYSPNALGIYDMSGNVWELCSDWYDSYYYEINSHNNPVGASSGNWRVTRGGSWFNGSQHCRVSIRYHNTPNHREFDLGFRIVASSGLQ